MGTMSTSRGIGMACLQSNESRRVLPRALLLAMAPWLAVALAALAVPSARSEQRLARDPATVAAASEKLRAASEVREVPPRVPLDVPEPAELSCATPCTAGTLTATHPYYDIFLSCSNGAYTARTGASHSVTAAGGFPQNVIYGGQAGSPSTSDVSFRFHDLGTTYLNPGGASACAFDPPDTASEPASVGLESEWRVSPATGIDVVLREEIVAFGTTENDSGIRLTLAVSNEPSSAAAVNVGFRWQIDYQNASDDGPLFATVRCDPLEVVQEFSLEHELSDAEILDFYRIQNNSGFPIFSNLTSTTPIAGIANTARPDRLVYGVWGSLRSSPWDYLTNEGAFGPDNDSAVLYYLGYLPADGFIVEPGRTVTRSVVIFTSASSVDCGGFTPGCAPSIDAAPTDATTCGGPVELDGSGVGLTDCDGSVMHSWEDAAGPVGTGPVITVSPATTTDYTLRVECSTDAACFTELPVRVTVEEPPELSFAAALDAHPCNAGVLVEWAEPAWNDAGGERVYNVYRSTVDAGDAIAAGPVATGLTETAWVDRDAPTNVELHYVVEAENGIAGTLCEPSGPHHGGAVDRVALAPIVDALGVEERPEGVGAVLFLSHDGPVVTLEWPAARVLEEGERFVILQADDDVNGSWRLVAPSDPTGRRHVDDDPSGTLRFFDLRVEEPCGRLSADEFPPGWDA